MSPALPDWLRLLLRNRTSAFGIALLSAIVLVTLFALLSFIAASGADEVCACDLLEPSGRSQPTVSHHLKVLHEAGLLDRIGRRKIKKGKFV